MYNIEIVSRTLHFKQPAATSRGVYTEHRIWLLKLTDNELPGRVGIGECAPLPGLSCDALPNTYEQKLYELCRLMVENKGIDYSVMRTYPSMLFGLETAVLNLKCGTKFYDTAFTRGDEGIPTNGLVWMGSKEEMQQRIEDKINNGFKCVKLKIGAIDFESELELIRNIRKRFSKDVIELRVDANGAFQAKEALRILDILSRYDIHSIEQPIKAGQWREMETICRNTPLPIALDEELIGINNFYGKEELLNTLKPQYIVVKPSLHGALSGAREWIKLANERGIGSWITSSLESNVGLSAIAQFASYIYGDSITFPQGLGTGLLYIDNIDMNVMMEGCKIWFRE